MDSIISEIVRRLQALSPSHQLLFFYVQATKLAPYYHRWASAENTGNPDVLQAITDCLYAAALDTWPSTQTVAQHTKALETLVFDTDEYAGSLSASQALDACSFFYEVLEYLADHQTDHLPSLVALCLRPVETFVQQRDQLDPNLRTPQLNQYFLLQAIVLRTLAELLELLDVLSSSQTLTPEMIALQQPAPAQAPSFIGSVD